MYTSDIKIITWVVLYLLCYLPSEVHICHRLPVSFKYALPQKDYTSDMKNMYICVCLNINYST